MTSIARVSEKDFRLLSEIAKLTFRESHGHCANPEDVNIYVTEKYSPAVIKEELNDEKNIYFIIYHNNRPDGYSKIILETPYPDSQL